MNVTYQFRFEDSRPVEFKVTDQPAEAKNNLPGWTRLEHCQCSNCPLKASDSPQCPAAV